MAKSKQQKANNTNLSEQKRFQNLNNGITNLVGLFNTSEAAENINLGEVQNKINALVEELTKYHNDLCSNSIKPSSKKQKTPDKALKILLPELKKLYAFEAIIVRLKRQFNERAQGNEDITKYDVPTTEAQELIVKLDGHQRTWLKIVENSTTNMLDIYRSKNRGKSWKQLGEKQDEYFNGETKFSLIGNKANLTTFTLTLAPGTTDLQRHIQLPLVKSKGKPVKIDQEYDFKLGGWADAATVKKSAQHKVRSAIKGAGNLAGVRKKRDPEEKAKERAEQKERAFLTLKNGKAEAASTAANSQRRIPVSVSTTSLSGVATGADGKSSMLSAAATSTTSDGSSSGQHRSKAKITRLSAPAPQAKPEAGASSNSDTDHSLMGSVDSDPDNGASASGSSTTSSVTSSPIAPRHSLAENSDSPEMEREVAREASNPASHIGSAHSSPATSPAISPAHSRANSLDDNAIDSPRTRQQRSTSFTGQPAAISQPELTRTISVDTIAENLAALQETAKTIRAQQAIEEAQKQQLAEQQAAEEAQKQRLVEQQAAAEAQKQRLAEQQAAEEAQKQRLAEQQAAAEAQKQRLAEQQAAAEAQKQQLAEQQAAEEAQKQQLAEQQAAEEAQKQQLAEQQAAEEAQKQRLVEQQAAAEAQKQRLAEQQAAAEAQKQRLAEQQAAAEAQKQLLAEQQAAEEAQKQQLAEQQAAEEAQKQQLAEQQAAEEAQKQRLVEQQAAAEAQKQRLAEQQAAAEAQKQRLAEQQAAEEAQKQRLAEQQAAAEAQKQLLAEQQEAEAARAQKSPFTKEMLKEARNNIAAKQVRDIKREFAQQYADISSKLAEINAYLDTVVTSTYDKHAVDFNGHKRISIFDVELSNAAVNELRHMPALLQTLESMLKPWRHAVKQTQNNLNSMQNTSEADIEKANELGTLLKLTLDRVQELQTAHDNTTGKYIDAFGSAKAAPKENQTVEHTTTHGSQFAETQSQLTLYANANNQQDDNLLDAVEMVAQMHHSWLIDPNEKFQLEADDKEVLNAMLIAAIMFNMPLENLVWDKNELSEDDIMENQELMLKVIEHLHHTNGTNGLPLRSAALDEAEDALEQYSLPTPPQQLSRTMFFYSNKSEAKERTVFEPAVASTSSSGTHRATL